MTEQTMGEQTSEGRQQPHCAICEASEAIGRFFRAIGPSEEAAGHFRQSRIEFLKGIRRIIDERIEHLGHTQHKGTRVTVE